MFDQLHGSRVLLHPKHTCSVSTLAASVRRWLESLPHSNARNNKQHFLQAEIGQQYQFALDKSVTYNVIISLSSQRLRNTTLCLIEDTRVKEALHRLLYVTRIQS